LAKVIKLVTKN